MSGINKFKEINKNFVPTDIKLGDELFRNGIFVFNITKMIESIENFKGEIIIEDINVLEYRNKTFSVIDESHVESVDISIPIILAEICPNTFNVIDGHHRLEKAYRKRKHHRRVNGKQELQPQRRQQQHQSLKNKQKPMKKRSIVCLKRLNVLKKNNLKQPQQRHPHNFNNHVDHQE